MGDWERLTPDERHFFLMFWPFVASDGGIVIENLVEGFAREPLKPLSPALRKGRMGIKLDTQNPSFAKKAGGLAAVEGVFFCGFAWPFLVKETGIMPD
ncbi:hypothetical protein TNIN_272391 [Trichonephila inaurata madagascariensis]|uniref:Uncharacterized protein n=1 Tax=Trichonephila inaurata madagascariensis TaxID=2747483 RepID=A0A8X6X524_9ARAC|nr:hypothetical protein TNIN_272391 [Trichonephila inaurata madagascariensis]